MDSPATTPQKASLSDYLAAERTLLAWIRTGLAMMGFGFVVARFGLFLQQVQMIQSPAVAQPYGLSLWFGTALIGIGVIVNVLAGCHHLRLVQELNRGTASYSHRSNQAVAIALLLALVGLAMAIYLVSIRRYTRFEPGKSKEVTMSFIAVDGIRNIPSHYSVMETVERLKGLLQAKGVALFALVDHSGEAEKVGMTMPPTKLLIFGSPKAGTPVMLATPSIAIDLPLKILVWEDKERKVWISYNTPEYLKQRHGLPPELLQNIAVVETLAAKASE
jgi:uncharacterized protein (DUF302 family)/uncharacterized membrane protein YidH (DUF202 family)